MAQLDWHMDDIASAHVESQAELLTADAMQIRSSIDAGGGATHKRHSICTLQSIHQDEQSGLTILDLSSHHSPFAARARTLSDADTGSSASDDATIEGSLASRIARRRLRRLQRHEVRPVSTGSAVSSAVRASLVDIYAPVGIYQPLRIYRP